MNKFKDFSMFYSSQLSRQASFLSADNNVCRSVTHSALHVIVCMPGKINQGTVAQLSQDPGFFYSTVGVSKFLSLYISIPNPSMPLLQSGILLEIVSFMQFVSL
jgi:hypothetical protein